MLLYLLILFIRYGLFGFKCGCFFVCTHIDNEDKKVLFHLRFLLAMISFSLLLVAVVEILTSSWRAILMLASAFTSLTSTRQGHCSLQLVIGLLLEIYCKVVVVAPVAVI